MISKIKKIYLICLAVFGALTLNAQESLRPLNGNINYFYSDLNKKGFNNTNQRNKNAGSLQIPFKDDFFYSTTQSCADPNLWESDSTVYVNPTHAIAPPSIGVATFDGLNKHGYPYNANLLNMTFSLPADTLTSRPINLLTAGVQTLQPSDSVALTFYYQARGFGDAPELSDTLILDFYNPVANVWNTNVWFERGNPNANVNDTIFKRAFVKIDSAFYLQDGFKFRFRNKATTAGDFDHWHLDYVYLNQNRHLIPDTAYDDIAIGFVPTPFLRQYSSMPWEQYNNTERASKNSVFIRNNGTDSLLNMSYEYKIYDNTNALVHSYNGGANPALGLFRRKGWSTHAPHANPAFTYTFSPLTDSADFRIKHFIYRSGSLPDFFPGNDTVIQYQKFRNYYAYDDGSAEAAYYVSGTGVKIAQKFTVNNTDTLQSVRIYFDPIGSIPTATSAYFFRISIWNSLQPGANPIYRDSAVSPKYFNFGIRGVPEYSLTTPQVLPPGDYYIGFQQKVAAGIGIGFDRNLNHMDNLYFDSGSGWTQSAIPGSLMIHPVFGKKIPPPVGIKENSLPDKTHWFNVYPNPANNKITVISNSEKVCSYQLVNVMGQIVDENISAEALHNINTALLENGVYFLILRSDNRPVQKQKIIVLH